MFRSIKSALVTVGLSLAVVSAGAIAASATSVLELGAPTKNKLDSLGVVPEKEEIVLKLGALRLGEAKLPPGELTLAERNRMRIRAAVEIQNAVSNARRNRLANRNAPAGTPVTPVAPAANEDDADDDRREADDEAVEPEDNDVAEDEDADNNDGDEDNSSAENGPAEGDVLVEDGAVEIVDSDNDSGDGDDDGSDRVAQKEDFRPAQVPPSDGDEVVTPKFN